MVASQSVTGSTGGATYALIAIGLVVMALLGALELVARVIMYMHVRKHGYSWNACLYVATARGARLDARLAELGIPICDTAAPARLNGSLNWNARFAQTIPFASRYATGVIPEPRNQDLESTHQEKLSIRTLAADTQDMATLPRYYDIQQLPPQCYQETFVWGCEDAVRE